MEFYVGGGGTNIDRTTQVTCDPTKAYPKGAPAPVDLWLAQPNGGAEGPAVGLNGSFPCAAEPPSSMHIPGAPHVNVCPNDDDGSGCPPYPGFPGEQVAGCKYEDALFTDFVLKTIADHDPAEPLFVFWAPHIAHTPLQVPKRHLDLFAHVQDWRRRRYLAMVNYLDASIGAVVDALKKKGMFESTLVTFSADNGGPVYANGTSGGSNWPLRGGKASNFEGGIRVNGWVSGGALPDAVRSTKKSGLATPWDWWSTFAEIGGNIDPVDHKAAAAGLPPVDSISQWQYWSGATDTPPRKVLAVGSCVSPSLRRRHPENHGFDLWCTTPDDVTTAGGVLVDEGPGGGLWKLLREPVIPMNGWQGPSFPNLTVSTDYSKDLGRECADGCLFQLDADPTEHHDVSADPANAARVKKMGALLKKLNASAFTPDRGTGPDFEASCEAAHERWGGFWGPFVDVDVHG